MKTRQRFCAFLAVLFALTPVRADVLFIDLNNSPLEVEQARKAAEIRGEKLIVLPKISDSDASALKATRATLRTATSAKTRACAQTGSDRCAAATASMTEAQKANDAALGAIPKLLSQADLSKALAKLNAAHVNLSSVVLSGHHTDKDFWGILASLNEKSIEGAFLQNKPLGDNVRSLYLWGCYAGTDDDFLKNWKDAFPNTSLMAGFGGQAPLSIRPSSGVFLGDLMTKEKDFTETQDRQQLMGLFNSLDDVNHVNAQICLNRDIVVSKKGARTLQDDIQACGHRSREEIKQARIYRCYRDAGTGCADVPDVNNEQSDLRKAYDYFQETRECDEALQQKGTPREENQQDVRRILFDKPVRYSFEKLNLNELAQMNSIMDSLGLPPELHLAHLSTLTRKDYLAKVNAIEAAYESKMDDARDVDGRVSDTRVVALGNYITQIEAFHRGECVPLEWVEEDPDLHDSECGIHKGMVTAVSDAQEQIRQAYASGRAAPPQPVEPVLMQPVLPRQPRTQPLPYSPNGQTPQDSNSDN